ncbi:MAG: bifunctional adenosylcobinamide kinase/adenosylcobinamide-phosphate guanylyltransferase [Proteobacteria bacterium]|nr:MAG: bifunctional adenosylcobinamide kinase/adenosylcobinamide-phosphate guanylyltransferase [Pseudomonadota bacterium]
MSLTLVLGGARSGKSAYAEKRAAETGNTVVYIATAQIHDEAIEKRVALHRETRPAEWQTVESPLELASNIKQLAAKNVTLLVDCLTMWLTNLLCTDDATRLTQEVESLLQSLSNVDGEIILVSNEVGLGVIPMGALTREYVDTAGKLHQRIAAIADNVVMVVAGIPMEVKGRV